MGKVVALADIDFRQVVIRARSNEQIDAGATENVRLQSFLEELRLSGDCNAGPIVEINCS